MGINEQRIQLKRSSPQIAWGFRLQGGSDSSTPLSVQRVFSGSPSDGQLQRGDILVSVDGRSLRGMSPLDAQDLITSTGLVLNLGIQRGENVVDHSYDSLGSAPQSNYISQHDNYSSGGGRSFDPHPQGDFSSGGDSRWSAQQPSSSWDNDPTRGHGAYQPPLQFNAGGGSRQAVAQNHYSPGTGSSHTNGSYQDHHLAGNQTYKSSATMFGGAQTQSHSSNDGGLYGAGGPSVVSQPRNDNDDEDYERKSISNIKQMFNKPDETGPSAVAHIKGRRPRAPMYKANEESSFVTPHYGPDSTPAQKSSLTPSRPGAVQRGAPDNRPSSYIPSPIKPPAAGSYAKKLYGYSQDTTPAPSRYVGGFVGISELTKSTPAPVPVKRPPGQKKKDFDPSQSSVLRILQEEEERRKSGRGGGPVEEFDQQPRPPPQQQQQRHHQQQQQQRRVGQKWEHQQQHQQHHQTHQQAKSGGGGPSLQALLERDQAQNPQEDPANNRGLYESQPQPSQGEYRRPGTTYKPAEHKIKANIDDYPIPEHYLSGGKSSGQQHVGDIYQPGGAAGYQSSYQHDGGYPTGGGHTYQSSAKFSPGSGTSSVGGFSPRAGGGGSNGYYAGSAADYGRGSSGRGGGYYPSTNYGMDGLPASDF